MPRQRIFCRNYAQPSPCSTQSTAAARLFYLRQNLSLSVYSDLSVQIPGFAAHKVQRQPGIFHLRKNSSLPAPSRRGHSRI